MFYWVVNNYESLGWIIQVGLTDILILHVVYKVGCSKTNQC